MSSVDNYSRLVTSQHAARPKYTAMVAAVAQCFVDLQNFLYSLPVEFDPQSARWTELDAIGVRAGLDRNLRAVSPGLYVQAPPTGTVPLSDSDYSVLLRGKIGANLWDGTIAGAYANLTRMFNDTGAVLFMVDNFDMTITSYVAGAVLDQSMRQALACGYLQARPAGVLSNYLFTSAAAPVFGLDVENQFISGLDVGAWAVGV